MPLALKAHRGQQARRVLKALPDLKVLQVLRVRSGHRVLKVCRG